MISITTLDYDWIGHIYIKPYPDTGRIIYQRRISKNATLDGLSTISDFGYTASDNTLTIKVDNCTPAIIERLIYLVKNYPLLRLSNADGVFIGVLSNIRVTMYPVEFIFDVKQQIA
jgi:hypothetical protein